MLATQWALSVWELCPSVLGYRHPLFFGKFPPSTFCSLFSLLEIPVRNWIISHSNPLVFLFFLFYSFLLSSTFLQRHLPAFIEYLISAIIFFLIFKSYCYSLILISWMRWLISLSISFFSSVLYALKKYIFFCYWILLFLLNSLFLW